jgi:hypothetical protein
MNNNEELSKLLGLDEVINFESDSGKIELLRLMMKREDWSKFLFTINKIAGITVWGQNFIFVRYITDTTGLLARAAMEWLTAQKGEK